MTVVRNSFYGSALFEENWVPAPRYVLRRQRILDHMGSLQPGAVLDMGCGAGALLVDLAQQGFTCDGVEISDRARQVAEKFSENNDRISIHSDTAPEWDSKFDYLLSFEVLEHIEDDHAALSEWLTMLKAGGTAILSVPAHKFLWSASDVWVGHYRRYSKSDLVMLCERAGLEVISVEYYGFPIANVVGILRTFLHTRKLRKAKQSGTIDRHNQNVQSGVERSVETKLFKYMDSTLGRLIFRFGFLLQWLTRKIPFGNGLLIVARKK